MDWLIYISLFAVLMLIGAFVFHNNFRRLRNRVKRYADEIDLLYKERYENAARLVELAKQGAGTEKDAIESVWRARLISMGCNEFIWRSEENNKLAAALKRLVAVCGEYDGLKSKPSYLEVVEALDANESKIEENKGFFNDAVGKYNNSVRNFPGNIIAKAAGYGESDFVLPAEGENKASPAGKSDSAGKYRLRRK